MKPVSQLNQHDKMELQSLSDMHKDALGFITLVKLAERFAHTNQEAISKEIGRISMDLIEPEFATLDRRNLIERKKFLEHEYDTIGKLERFEEFEQKFINHGRSAVDYLGISTDSLINIGVPINTLKAARII